MVTKRELLEKLSNEQLREIAKVESVTIKPRARKKSLVDALLVLKINKIRYYVEEYNPPEKPSKKRRRRGKELENQVAEIFTDANFEVIQNDLVRGYSVKRPYEVDVHAFITEGFLFKKRLDVWVECKAHNVKREHIIKLVAAAEDVRLGAEKGIAEWYPDMLLACSNTGFDIDAIGWADTKGVYCLLIKHNESELIGKMTNDMFRRREPSNYY